MSQNGDKLGRLVKPAARLKVLFSVRTLFDLEEAHQIFESETDKSNPKKYIEYMRDMENVPLKPGPLLKLYRAMELINENKSVLGYCPFRLKVTAKDCQLTQHRVFKTLSSDDYREYNDFAFQTRAHQGGNYSEEWFKRYFNDVAIPGMFFTCNDVDAQTAADMGYGSAKIWIPEGAKYDHLGKDEVFDIWYDQDGVAYGSSSELVTKRDGMDAYSDNERDLQDQPIEPGPFTAPITSISQTLEDLRQNGITSPIRQNVCTTRGYTGLARFSNTAREYGHKYEDIHCMAGENKADMLEQAFAENRANLFLDDQKRHLEALAANPNHVVGGEVPWPKDSPMGIYMREQAQLAAQPK